MAGDAAFTVADTLWWGTFNDPAKSKIAGKVAATRFPLGPDRAKPFAWDDIDTDPAPTGVRESDELTRRRVTRADLDQQPHDRVAVDARHALRRPDRIAVRRCSPTAHAASPRD